MPLFRVFETLLYSLFCLFVKLCIFHYPMFLGHLYIPLLHLFVKPCLLHYTMYLGQPVYSIIISFFKPCLLHYTMYLGQPVLHYSMCFRVAGYHLPQQTNYQRNIFIPAFLGLYNKQCNQSFKKRGKGKKFIENFREFVKIHLLCKFFNILKKLLKYNTTIYNTPSMQVLQHFKEIVKIQHDYIQ